jgi:protocatechuate 3,4-dioxygenase beta subunit
MKRLAFVKTLVALFLLVSCNSQTKQQSPAANNQPIGGGCDGCELMYVDMPQQINATDTSEGWFEKGQKLIVSGTVFQPDGKTPASNVVIYYWQTDNAGYYSPKEGMTEKAKVHGHLRGWVKTNEAGEYIIYTIRPAPYPNDVLPAHIHYSIKEPDVANEYYTDDLNFTDDSLLAPYLKRYPQENRGGNGVVRTVVQNSVQTCRRDIILGLHIPNYRKS